MGALVPLRREVPTVWDDPEIVAIAVWLTLPWYRQLWRILFGGRPW